MAIEKEISLKANYKFTIASMEILDKIAKELNVDIKDVASYLRSYNGEYLDELRIHEGHNLVPSILRDSLALLISGTTVTPTFKANYIALGSDSTAATNDDVKLGTETIRSQFDDRSAVDNIAYLDKFFNASEVGGNTYVEAGVFVDGTASTDSGYLLSRIIMNETMTSTESLTVNVTITIN
jgi:hypothetical protein